MQENGLGQELDLYQELKRNILGLKLKPGLMLSMSEICETYHRGRTPVRDALLQLANDGLLVFLPQRGVRISKISLKRAESERFLRKCVEEVVVLESMASCSIEFITQMEESLKRQEEMLKEWDTRQREFMEEDDHFHSIFYRAAGRGETFELVKAMAKDYYRIRLLSLSEGGIKKRIIDEHRGMADALNSRDANRFRDLFIRHIHHPISKDAFLKYTELFEEDKGVQKKSEKLNSDFLVETKLKYNM